MIRIAVVGAGKIASNHIDAINKNDECMLAAVADIVLERAQALAGNGCECFSDYKQMYEKVKFDAVILNLPHFLHCEVSKFFLERGVCVLCEKPMANSVKECDEMIEAAKKGGTKLAIGHVQRYFRAYRIIKEYFESGKLGKLTRITEIRNINYFPNRPEWFLNKKLSGGGICMNYGAHTLDKIFYTTKLKVNSVCACMSNMLTDNDVEAGAQILFKLEDGASAMVNYSGCHVPGYYETVFYFTNGAIKTSDGNRVWVSDGGAYEEIEKDTDERTFMEKQLCEFIKFYKDEENEMADAEYAREIISVIEKIYNSASENQKMSNK